MMGGEVSRNQRRIGPATGIVYARKLFFILKSPRKEAKRRYIFVTGKRSLSVFLSNQTILRDSKAMNTRLSVTLVFALTGLIALGGARAGDEVQTSTVMTSPPAPSVAAKPKPKPHKARIKLEKTKPSTAEQYDAPLQLDFDPMKRVILKAEPAVPYQPQVASRLPPTQTNDDSGQPHLAPLLRENSTPESFGDKGSFIDRHEFGIQLRDHF
jgi:hypothetical protein